MAQFNKPVLSEEKTEAARSKDALREAIERELGQAGIRYRWCAAVPDGPVVLIDRERIDQGRAIIARVEARLEISRRRKAR